MARWYFANIDEVISKLALRVLQLNSSTHVVQVRYHNFAHLVYIKNLIREYHFKAIQSIGIGTVQHDLRIALHHVLQCHCTTTALFMLLHLLWVKFRSIVENSNGVFRDLYKALLRFSVLFRI